MKTIKLKIKNEIDLTKELIEFNSIVRYSFNRFQEAFKEKEILILSSGEIGRSIAISRKDFEKLVPFSYADLIN